MPNIEWTKELPAEITLCDPEGIVLEMNDYSARMFEKDGGRKLIGSNLLDCHPQPAREKLQEMLKTQQTNIYTTERQGIRKLVFQSPWYQDGRYCGFIEISFPLPAQMPHFVRD
jgi:transcriptional regulator with PAS, ATPase and Fis domain